MRTATYGARRREQCAASDVALGLSSGMCRILTCSRCNLEIVAWVEMHDKALHQSQVHGFVLVPMCFECTQEDPSTSPALKAAQRNLMKSAQRGAVIEDHDGHVLTIERIGADDDEPPKGGYVH